MSLRFNENTTGKTLQVRPQARLKFQAKPGEKYQLIDESTGKTPKDLEVTRQQNNLLLKSKSNDVEILIQDFWEACQPGDTQCFAIFDTAETVGGELVGQTIVTQEGPVLEALLAGEVGTLSESAILGVIGTSAAVISPVLGVVGGLVGLAAIGAAAGGGGGGSDGGSEPAKDTTPPKAPVIDKITNIDTNGDGKPDSTIITGKTEPSATVSIDIDGDGKPDATATADKDGNFELKVDQVLPSDKEYPVTSTDSNGNSSQPTQVKGDASDATAAVKAAEDAYATAKAKLEEIKADGKVTPEEKKAADDAIAAAEALKKTADDAVKALPASDSKTALQERVDALTDLTKPEVSPEFADATAAVEAAEAAYATAKAKLEEVNADGKVTPEERAAAEEAIAAAAALKQTAADAVNALPASPTKTALQGRVDALTDITAPEVTQLAAGDLTLENFDDTGVAGDQISSDNTFTLKAINQTAAPLGTTTYQVMRPGSTEWVDTTAEQATLADGTYQFRTKVTGDGLETVYSEPQTVKIDTSTPSPMVYMDVSKSEYVGDLFIEPGKAEGTGEVSAGAAMNDGSTMTIVYTPENGTESTLVLTKTGGAWTGTLPAGFTLDAASGKLAIENGTLEPGSLTTVTEYNINGKTASETNRAPIMANGILIDTWNETTQSTSFKPYYPPVSTADNDFIFISKSVDSRGRLTTGEGDDFVAIGSPASSDGGVQDGGQVSMGDGNDTLIVYDRIRGNGGTIVNMGKGNNILKVGNIHNNSKVSFESGDDVLSFIAVKNDELRHNFGYDSPSVDMGDGNNVVKTTESYGVNFNAGTITSGSGNDTFELQNSDWRGVTLKTGAGDDTVHLGKVTSGTIELGGGNDTFIINGDLTGLNNSFVNGGSWGQVTGGTINGGDGFDTFKFGTAGATLDVNGRLKGFEMIDMTGGGASTVKIANNTSNLNYSSLLADGATSPVNALLIKGDANDKVDLWVNDAAAAAAIKAADAVTYEGVSYNVYQGTGFQVWIQDTILPVNIY